MTDSIPSVGAHVAYLYNGWQLAVHLEVAQQGQKLATHLHLKSVVKGGGAVPLLLHKSS